MAKTKSILKKDDPSQLDENGAEIVSSEQVEIVIPTVSPTDKMRQLIKQAFHERVEEGETESFEDSIDFDIDDPFEDEEPETPYMKDEFIVPHREKSGEGADPPELATYADPPQGSEEQGQPVNGQAVGSAPDPDNSE